MPSASHPTGRSPSTRCSSSTLPCPLAYVPASGYNGTVTCTPTSGSASNAIACAVASPLAFAEISVGRGFAGGL